jgi:hypothetical protein
MSNEPVLESEGSTDDMWRRREHHRDMAFGTHTEALAFATELYTAVYDVARRHGKSYDDVVAILASTRDSRSPRRAA